MEVLLDDHILYRLHGSLQQSGVCGVGSMDVDLTIGDAVYTAESVGKVSYSSIKVGVGARVIREVFRNGRNLELSPEQIHLIQEEDDRLALEPFAIDERLEQHHSFVHLVLFAKIAMSDLLRQLDKRAKLEPHLPRSDLQPSIGRIQTMQP